jgi:hypothetical protein
MKRLVVLIFCLQALFAQKVLIPMDEAQNDHLKAYGMVYFILNYNIQVEWLLNYRGGSFLVDEYAVFIRECNIRGVSIEQLNQVELVNVYSTIDQNNMDMIELGEAPSIAVYAPPTAQPWDNAVTLALTYAEIPYQTIWDEQIFLGALNHYDWLHLHHEDFTGQYGKFYRDYRNTEWYQNQKLRFESLAEELDYASVHEEKKAVARSIKSFIYNGGSLFAMCSATDTYDLALAIGNVDAVRSVYDNSPADRDINSKLDFTQCLAFENFRYYPDPMVYEHSDIDFPPSNVPTLRNAADDYFSLFEFSAKYDPIPTMLTQNHSGVIKGFMGQTTGFRRDLVKKHIVIMGDDPGGDQVKYIHGNHGGGNFTFLGGHDPEDYQHFIGDPPTDLSGYKNSPGYRLILNNILLPAAKQTQRKT